MLTKRFLTLFLDFERVLIHKDVGSLPYYLATECGWSSSFAFFWKSVDDSRQITDDTYADVVNMIPLGVSGKKILNAFRIVRFLMLRSKEFDVVNIYHDSLLLLPCVLLYKLLNPSGRVYCKLDMSHLELELLIQNRKKMLPAAKRTLRYFLSRIAVDLYSVESTSLYKSLGTDRYFRDRLLYCPNGFTYDGAFDVEQAVRDKENIILTVGRLGSYQKHNELLIDAAARINKDLWKDWSIYFVGPITDDEFMKYKDSQINKHPHLKKAFVFTGNVSDKERLYDLYKRARIFCLTSRWEGFPLVLAEAMFFADYLISADLPPSRDLTKRGTIGSLFAIGDAQGLAEKLADVMNGKVDLLKNGRESHELIKNKFNWKVIVKEIDQQLTRLVEG